MSSAAPRTVIFGSESNSNKDHKINGQQKLSKNDLNTVETFWNIINDKAASDLSRLGSNNNNNSHSGAVRGNDISTTDESKMFDVIQKSSFYGIRDTRKLSVQSDTLTVTAAQSNLVSPLSPPTLNSSPVDENLDSDIIESVNALLQMKNSKEFDVSTRRISAAASNHPKKDRRSTGGGSGAILKTHKVTLSLGGLGKQAQQTQIQPRILPNPYQIIRENTSARRRASLAGSISDPDYSPAAAGSARRMSTNSNATSVITNSPSSHTGGSVLSPSLRHSSSWLATPENVEHFGQSTQNMDHSQKVLLVHLLNTFGPKIHGLELVFKPPTKRKPDARWIPKYVFQKCTWVEELWDEWKNGLNGLISLSELEVHWGSEWVLARKEVKHEKFRRMRVIRELKRLMEVNGWSEKEVMDYVAREVTGKGINARKWGDSLPKSTGNTTLMMEQDDMMMDE